MEYRLQRIAVLKTSMFIGLMYAVLTAVFIVPFALIALASRQQFDGALGSVPGAIALMIFLPVLYGIAGFIATAIASALYNVVARRFGGVQFTLDGVVSAAAPAIGQANGPNF